MLLLIVTTAVSGAELNAQNNFRVWIQNTPFDPSKPPSNNPTLRYYPSPIYENLNIFSGTDDPNCPQHGSVCSFTYQIPFTITAGTQIYVHIHDSTAGTVNGITSPADGNTSTSGGYYPPTWTNRFGYSMFTLQCGNLKNIYFFGRQLYCGSRV